MEIVSITTAANDELAKPKEGFNGGTVWRIGLTIYACYALALICENYFVPSLYLFVKRLGLGNDVGGATLMAFGSSAPGLFLSIIGTFVTTDDLGLGDIIGSCVFNACAITGVCGLIIEQQIKLDWWSLTRDFTFYFLSLGLLAVTVFDSKVYWFECIVMMAAYALYVVVLCYDKTLRAVAKRYIRFMRKVLGEHKKPSNCPCVLQLAMNLRSVAPVVIHMGPSGEEKKTQPPPDVGPSKEKAEEMAGADGVATSESSEGSLLLWSVPKDSVFRKIMWVLTLPITLLCFLCLADCRRENRRKYFLLTFTVSIILIGLITYSVSIMVTAVGTALNISDALMGYTALAIGTSMPDAMCSLTVARQGHGTMALANGLGSNILDILVNLSMPWFIQSVAKSPGAFVIPDTGDILYMIVFMVASVVIIYVLFICYRFHLNRKVGAASLLIYAIFLAGSVMLDKLLYD